MLYKVSCLGLVLANQNAVLRFCIPLHSNVQWARTFCRFFFIILLLDIYYYFCRLFPIFLPANISYNNSVRRTLKFVDPVPFLCANCTHKSVKITENVLVTLRYTKLFYALLLLTLNQLAHAHQRGVQ